MPITRMAATMTAATMTAMVTVDMRIICLL
jgi:hypothetical protein